MKIENDTFAMGQTYAGPQSVLLVLPMLLYVRCMVSISFLFSCEYSMLAPMHLRSTGQCTILQLLEHFLPTLVYSI